MPAWQFKAAVLALVILDNFLSILQIALPSLYVCPHDTAVVIDLQCSKTGMQNMNILQLILITNNSAYSYSLKKSS